MHELGIFSVQLFGVIHENNLSGTFFSIFVCQFDQS